MLFHFHEDLLSFKIYGGGIGLLCAYCGWLQKRKPTLALIILGFSLLRHLVETLEVTFSRISHHLTVFVKLSYPPPQTQITITHMKTFWGSRIFSTNPPQNFEPNRSPMKKLK